MRTQDDLNNKLNQLTQSQLQAALLEMTGDLDKAQVLQKKLPGWMVNAPPGVLDALTRDAVRVAEAQAVVTECMKPLRGLDEFCNERLKDYCLTRWQLSVEPKRCFYSCGQRIRKRALATQVCENGEAGAGQPAACGDAEFLGG